MSRQTFSHKGNWGVLVKKIKKGEWEAFVRMLPLPGVHGGYVRDGELVPGGPYENRDAASTAGEKYVTMKNR